MTELIVPKLKPLNLERRRLPNQFSTVAGRIEIGQIPVNRERAQTSNVISQFIQGIV